MRKGVSEEDKGKFRTKKLNILKIKEDKHSEENNRNLSKKKFTVSLKIQLLVGFLLPVVFVVLVGVVSYKKAEQGMIDNYETSVRTTIDTQMEYLDFGLSLIRTDAIQIKTDEELQNLMSGVYAKDLTKASNAYNKKLANLRIKKTLNTFIKDIYIIPKSGNSIISTSDVISNENGFYEKWSATEEGKLIQDKNSTGWLGKHPEMDALSGHDSEDYFLAFMTIFPDKSTVLTVDISRNAIVESLSAIDLTQGAMVAFVTAEGREILLKEESNPLELNISEQEFYLNAIGGSLQGIKYITLNNEEYLFIYSTSEETKATLVYMIPKGKVVSSAAEIKILTLIIVIIACIISILIGLGILLNIMKSMNSIIKRLKKVATGDLTIEMKRDGSSEFIVLNEHISDVIKNTRQLISEVNQIVDMVNDAALKVDSISDKMENSSNAILSALDEIDAGVGQQALDTQQCLMQMDSLSRSMETIGKDMEGTVNNSKSTQNIVTSNIKTMNELADQTNDTILITSKVKNDVEVLAKRSDEIRKFVDIIADIVAQTNLLSLNASIEAARAGEAGRGFAVVAEEIRKLADGSQQAANEINKVVEIIGKETEATVETAVHAEKIVEKQEVTVGRTKQAFEEINSFTENVIDNIIEVTNSIERMDVLRIETLEAISSISAVSEQTAASSGSVYNIAQEQKEVVVALQEASKELKVKMRNLKRAVSIFITEI